MIIRKILATTVFTLSSAIILGQVKFGANPTQTDSAAALEIESTNKGILIPRLADTNSVAVTSKGLLIYANQDSSFYFFNGSKWKPLLSESSSSENSSYLSQNSTTGTISFVNAQGDSSIAQILSSDNNNFLVTGADGGLFLDQNDVNYWEKTNSNIHFSTGGNVGIGTNNPDVPLHVNGEVKMTNLPTSNEGNNLIIDQNGNIKKSSFNNAISPTDLEDESRVIFPDLIASDIDPTGPGYITANDTSYYSVDLLGKATFIGPTNQIIIKLGEKGKALFLFHKDHSGSNYDLLLGGEKSLLTEQSYTYTLSLPISTKYVSIELVLTNETGNPRHPKVRDFRHQGLLTTSPINNNPNASKLIVDQIGIGTASPRYPLEIGDRHSYAADRMWAAYIKKDANHNMVAQPGSSNKLYGNISIASKYDVLARAYIVESDERIKNVHGRSNSLDDLNTLKQIQITDYQLIDTIQNGSQMYKKVLAQQVKEVYPEAISDHQTKFIPHIYQLAKAITPLNHDTFSISIAKHHELMINDKVQFINSDGKSITVIVTGIPSSHQFIVKGELSANSNYFVFGKEVSDFHAVDYDALTTLSISAIQQVVKEKETLQKKLSELENELDLFRTQYYTYKESTQSDIIELKSQIGQLIQFFESSAQTVK